MPSLAHEILVDLFRSRPALAAEILVEALGVALPSYTGARVASADLTEVQPAEYRADLVVLLHDGDAPVHVLIVEVQLARDPDKRYSLPAYVTVSRAVHRCPACLLVVASDPAVAAWCAEPIETGVPDFVLRPPVLGPALVPVVTDPAEATRRPELGVLSVIAHGKGELGATIAAAVLPAIGDLDEKRAGFYADIVYDSLNEATRRALEAKMIKGYQYQSDIAKKWYDEGRAQGEAKGEARALLTTLRARGIPVPEDARERILAEKDVARLERWVERAAVAASLAEVLDEPS